VLFGGRAREAAEQALAKFEHRINSALKPAEDVAAVGVHAQIRDRLLALTDTKERVNFFAKNGKDLTLIAAALGAPAYLSNLTPAEETLLRRNFEACAPPEIVAERDRVITALAELDRGYRAAAARVTKLAALRPGAMPPLRKPAEPVKPQLTKSGNCGPGGGRVLRGRRRSRLLRRRPSRWLRRPGRKGEQTFSRLVCVNAGEIRRRQQSADHG
jgi:hypothetical protein